MARKSTEFEIVFHYPSDDEGKQLLAKAIGDVHTKAIKEIIDKNISDLNKKNKIITEIQNKMQNQNGINIGGK